ncbi:MAG: RNA polymerase sigma-70 factor [Chitinophagaceae bacterium]
MNTALLYDERILLQQVAKGDAKAFRIIFDTYRTKLYTYIFGFVKSGQVAEELVMDVFMKLWTGKELVVQIENFDAFLFRVAHNKTIDFLRSVAKNPDFQELLWDEMQLVSDAFADNALLSREYEDKVREAISLLSPQRKKVYQLSREMDLTHDEIAAQLNLSKSTVNNHLVEAKQFIRHYLVNKFDLAILILIISKN